MPAHPWIRFVRPDRIEPKDMEASIDHVQKAWDALKQARIEMTKLGTTIGKPSKWSGALANIRTDLLTCQLQLEEMNEEFRALRKAKKETP